MVRAMVTRTPRRDDEELIDLEWMRESSARSGPKLKGKEEVNPLLAKKAMDRIAERLDSEQPIEATLPDVARQLYDLSQDVNASYDRIAKVAGQDPQIAARLIHLANTSYYQRDKPADTLRDAVFRIGLGAIQTMLILPALEKRLVRDEVSTKLWRHSRVVAAVMPFLAGLAKVRPDPAMLAGLLHDVGRIVLWLELGKDKLIAPFVDDLGDVLHEKLGGELARRWSFPESVVAAVEHHHAPDPECATSEAERLPHVVCIGDRLVRSHELGLVIDASAIPSVGALQIPERPVGALFKRIAKLEAEALH